jgi:class 3 adenylate cyclase
MFPSQKGAKPPQETRYDVDTLQEVTVLAARLQSQQEQQQEQVTARQMEMIGAEVGVDPAFIQQALAQVNAERTAPAPGRATPQPSWTPEKLSVAGALSVPFLWSAVALISRESLTWPLFFWFFAPAPLAALAGYFAGQRKWGFLTGVGLILGLAMAATLSFPAQGSDAMIFPLVYSAIGAPIAGLMGLFGASIRERRPASPPSDGPALSRPELLRLLYSMQGRLDGQRRHRAFLSVDVIGSPQMKRGAPDLDVEFSFGQFRVWAEEIVRAHGGEMQIAVGDGMMCVFTEDAAAIRSARELLDGLSWFNEARNRLSLPFRLRCGVSGGMVAIEQGMPLEYLHSPVLDHAAALRRHAQPGDILVSSEVATAALLELGVLARLPEPVDGEPAFSWAAGKQRPGALA